MPFYTGDGIKGHLFNLVKSIYHRDLAIAFHENERQDRDEWVTFHGGETATVQSEIDFLGTPYDYCSIMHPSENKSIAVTIIYQFVLKFTFPLLTCRVFGPNL